MGNITRSGGRTIGDECSSILSTNWNEGERHMTGMSAATTVAALVVRDRHAVATDTVNVLARMT